MTILGPDISSYQHGLDLSRLSAASFVIAKVTEGTYYSDADYIGWRDQCTGLGKPFVWYHYLSTEDPALQAAHTLAKVGDASLPGMLDFEQAGTTLAQALAYVDAAHQAGLNLRLVYLPRWFWLQLGAPPLSGFAQRGVQLVSSSYPGGTGSPTQLYPGDGAAGWQTYGGMTPLLYQYTDQASDGGMSLDYNAFTGTLPELEEVLSSSPASSTPIFGGSTVATIPPSIGQFWPEIAGQFPANQNFDNETALIWADGGARAAALYAKQARDAVNALAGRIGAPPVVDVAALAAALAPYLANGATAEQIATAVAQHLGADLAKG